MNGVTPGTIDQTITGPAFVIVFGIEATPIVTFAGITADNINHTAERIMVEQATTRPRVHAALTELLAALVDDGFKVWPGQPPQ